MSFLLFCSQAEAGNAEGKAGDLEGTEATTAELQEVTEEGVNVSLSQQGKEGSRGTAEAGSKKQSFKDWIHRNSRGKQHKYLSWFEDGINTLAERHEPSASTQQ